MFTEVSVLHPLKSFQCSIFRLPQFLKKFITQNNFKFVNEMKITKKHLIVKFFFVRVVFPKKENTNVSLGLIRRKQDDTLGLAGRQQSSYLNNYRVEQGHNGHVKVIDVPVKLFFNGLV